MISGVSTADAGIIFDAWTATIRPECNKYIRFSIHLTLAAERTGIY
jgi:hypothetical protein